MSEKTLDKIKAIEEHALEIIKQAEHACALSLKNTQKKHQQELLKIEEQAKKQGEDLAQSTGQAAQKEAKEIEKQAALEIKKIQNRSSSKIDPAKKEILRCLS